jgi:GNAT superfamily N-acetyltransferase
MIRVRPAQLDDAGALARLSGMFGYDADPVTHERRLAALLTLDSQGVWVAQLDDTIAGWINACIRQQLESDAYVEVTGLVVDAGLRGRGIGAALLEQAEAWARHRGYTSLRVRSNLLRERAHAFYRREGYADLKQQQVFVKRL